MACHSLDKQQVMRRKFEFIHNRGSQRIYYRCLLWIDWKINIFKHDEVICIQAGVSAETGDLMLRLGLGK
jgi:hypothetical protein